MVGKCQGTCADCSGLRATESGAAQIGRQERTSVGGARTALRRIQAAIGILLFLSASVGIFLLATDRSLWLLAVSHAAGLIMIVGIDFVLGAFSIFSRRNAYLPSIAAALLGVILQLGDVFTAPQYNMTIPYFASYLFGIWAFDFLLALQLAVVVIGVFARPYVLSLARRKTRRGRELNYTRRGFLTALAGLAGVVGIGVLLSSIKLPPPTSQSTSATTTTQTSGGAKGIANTNTLKVGAPVYFEYPSGYPNMLLKNSDGSLTALSLLCTHVCCQCSYDSAAKIIYCPCHGSEFDISGQVLRGPANAPLPSIELSVDGQGNVTPTGVKNPGPCHA